MKSQAQLSWVVFLGVALTWTMLHFLLRDTLIFHDAWRHVFPITYGVAMNSSCGDFAYWLNSPDTGAETVILALNVSLTHPIRALLMALWSCTRPQPFDAMYFYEIQIFVAYALFSIGMFVLGRVLFRHWLTPIYLLAASLFAGLGVQVVHSDQYTMLVFWMPWCAAAAAIAHRRAGSLGGAAFVSLMALFFCLALNDQEPHAAALAGGFALLIYSAFNARKVGLFLIRWPHLWPSLMLFGICLAGFYVIKDRIFEYLPSEHTDIVTHPSTMGETGFVQPGTLLTAMFPLSFTSNAEEIRQGILWRAYNFRLDVVLFYIGSLPLLLLFSLLPRGGLRKGVLGWSVFSLLMLLLSMQKTYLYYLFFHLPFFEIYRNYFFYSVYAVVGVLVLSGYGLDRLLTTSPEERQAILSATLRFAIPIFAAGATAIAIQKQTGGVVPILTFAGVYGALALVAKSTGGKQGGSHGVSPASRQVRLMWLAAVVVSFLVLAVLLKDTDWLENWWAIVGDAIILATAFGLIGWAKERSKFGAHQAAVLIAALVVSQSLFIVGAYASIGEPARAIFDRYKVDATLLEPYRAQELDTVVNVRRVSCATHGACYLAQRYAASAKRDRDGTWLRLKQNPIYRKDLSPHIQTELLVQPMVWESAGMRAMSSLEALDAVIKQHEKEIVSLLHKDVFVVGGSPNGEEQPGRLFQVTFSQWNARPNRISFRYRATADGFANLNIAFSPYWKATVNDTPTQLISGNYGTIALPLSRGDGAVRLVYDDPESRLYFWSRWIMATIGIFGMGVVARAAKSIPNTALGGGADQRG